MNKWSWKIPIEFSGQTDWFAVGDSQIPGAGNGLFAARDLSPGVALIYGGYLVNSSLEVYAPEDEDYILAWSEYHPFAIRGVP